MKRLNLSIIILLSLGLIISTSLAGDQNNQNIGYNIYQITDPIAPNTTNPGLWTVPGGSVQPTPPATSSPKISPAPTPPSGTPVPPSWAAVIGIEPSGSIQYQSPVKSTTPKITPAPTPPNPAPSTALGYTATLMTTNPNPGNWQAPDNVEPGAKGPSTTPPVLGYTATPMATTNPGNWQAPDNVEPGAKGPSTTPPVLGYSATPMATTNPGNWQAPDNVEPGAKGPSTTPPVLGYSATPMAVNPGGYNQPWTNSWNAIWLQILMMLQGVR